MPCLQSAHIPGINGVKLTQGDHITGINALPPKSACINALPVECAHITGIKKWKVQCELSKEFAQTKLPTFFPLAEIL
jgi:hypothetical protein